MWLATGSSWMRFIRRQLRFDSRIQHRAVGALSSKALLSWSRDPKNVDLIIGEHDFPGKEVKHTESLRLKAKKLADVLECSVDETTEILNSYPEILSKPLDRLLWTARVLKFRYPLQEILRYPSCLNLSWRLMENRRLIFEEINAMKVNTLSALLRFEELCALTLLELRRRQIISTVNLLPSILSKIENCPPNLGKDLSEMLSSSAVLALTLTEYRRIIIEAYFATWFGKNRIKWRIMKILEKQSLSFISIRMNILLDELQFDPSFLKAQQAFLVLNTHNLSDMVDKVSTLRNRTLSDVVKANPLILTLSAQRLCEVEKFLLAQKAKDDHIARLPQIYNIHPNLLKQEFPFENSDQDPETYDSMALMQWMHFHHIQARLGNLAMRNNKMIQNDPDFKMMVPSWHGVGRGVVNFLAAELEADEKQLRSMKRSMSHLIMKRTCDFSKCSQTCDFLLKQGICSKEQLTNNILICMWTVESIQKIWEEFPKEPYEEALGPNWKSSPYLTEMIVYELENLGVPPHSKMELRKDSKKEMLVSQVKECYSEDDVTDEDIQYEDDPDDTSYP